MTPNRPPFVADPIALSANAPSWETLAACLSGEASPQQAAAIEEWAAKDNEHRETLHQLRAAWDESQFVATDEQIEFGWQRLAVETEVSGLHAPSRGTHAGRLHVPRRDPLTQGGTRGRRWWGAAGASVGTIAALAAVLVASPDSIVRRAKQTATVAAGNRV